MGWDPPHCWLPPVRLSMAAKLNPAFLALLGPTVALTAHAEVYMSSQQALEQIFPGAKAEKSFVTLTDDEVAQIQKRSGQEVRNKKIEIWKDKNHDVLYVDQVLGKHEFITFAVGIQANGKVKGIEILEYRESYGQQVRQPAWKNQFNEKDTSSPLTLEKDIKNISGATLSSLHITNGVRRLLFTHDTVKNRL